MIVSKDKIKFGPRVREIDRKYEENNNQEVDNGVYNQFEDSDSDKASKEEEVDHAMENQKRKFERCAEIEAALTPLEIASRMEIKEEVLERIEKAGYP